MRSKIIEKEEEINEDNKGEEINLIMSKINSGTKKQPE